MDPSEIEKDIDKYQKVLDRAKKIGMAEYAQAVEDMLKPMRKLAELDNRSSPGYIWGQQ